uniref:NADH dehydrogenase subunit 4L n=1 Tax=Ciconiphilus decimfasciatus TaxID=2212705 RepID=UPI0025804F86|nr:NADH dehydrogenase subunit 4L [Ciconiphilus decimfasciatus]WGW14993.1 NADH dehydrogenase subunit 4L [Ciconiphilus decimfasciatus]
MVEVFVFSSFVSIIKMMVEKKMILILMSIEFLMMSIYFLLHNFHSWFFNSTLSVIFLTFMVCESVLGLSLYIYMSRISGKDSLKSMSLSKF